MKFHKIIALSALAVVIVAYCVGLGITFARYRDDFTGNGNATVATPLAKYNRDGMFRTSSTGEVVTISLDGDSSVVTVSDIQPEDKLDFYFSVSDTDGSVKNEVLLRVVVKFNVALRMKSSDGNSVYYYIDARQEYSDNTDMLVNSSVRLYRDVIVSNHGAPVNGVDVLPNNEITDVDYSSQWLFVEQDGGVFNHKVGFFLHPAGNVGKSNTFRLSVNVPGQAELVDKYAGAQLVISVEILAEQVLEI